MDDTTKHPSPHEDPEENPRVAYEHGDADVFSVSKYAIALAFGVLIAASAMWALLSWFQTQQTQEVTKLAPAVVESRRTALPPEPRLQSTPKLDLRQFREAEEAAIREYHWVDGSKTTARIPIEDAIAMLAKRGLPWKPVKGGEGLDSDGYRLLPEKSSGGRTVEKIAQ